MKYLPGGAFGLKCEMVTPCLAAPLYSTTPWTLPCVSTEAPRKELPITALKHDRSNKQTHHHFTPIGGYPSIFDLKPLARTTQSCCITSRRSRRESSHTFVLSHKSFGRNSLLIFPSEYHCCRCGVGPEAKMQQEQSNR